MSHVDDGQLNALLDGELKGAERAAVEQHLAACAECRARYAEAREFLIEASDLLGMLDESVGAAPVAPAASVPAPGGGRRSTVTSREKAIDIDGVTGKVPAVTVPPSGHPPGVPPEGRRSSVTAREKAIEIDGATGKTPAVRIEAAPPGGTTARAEPVTAKSPAIGAVPPPTPHASESPEGAAPGARPLFGHGTARSAVSTLRIRPRHLALAAVIALAIGVGYYANELTRGAPDYTAGGERDPIRATAETAGDTRPAASAPGGGGGSAPAGRLTRPPRATAPKSNAPAGPAPEEAVAARSRSGPAEAARVPRVSPTPRSEPSAAPQREAPGAVGAPYTGPLRAPARPPAGQAPAADASGLAAATGRAPIQAVARARETAGSEPPLTSFRAIDPENAIQRLSGAIRLIDGMVPRRYEVGPGRLVPGADPDRVVVRVVYSDSLGRRILLDQQPGSVSTDTGAARRTSVNGLMQGDTLASTDRSESRVRWLDRKNFWLSLSGQIPADSLRALIARIR